MVDDRSGVRSVQLALDVLEAVGFSGEELGVTQLADRLDLTKGSVHRHLHTLVDRGYLVQNPATTRYALGPKSRLLARLAPDADLVRIAEGPMRELRDALTHSVVLSAATPRGALVLNTVQGTSAIEIGVRPGSELSFHASAQGKILLAFSPRPRAGARARAAARCLHCAYYYPYQAYRGGTRARRSQRVCSCAGRGDARHQCDRSAYLR